MNLPPAFTDKIAASLTRSHGKWFAPVEPSYEEHCLIQMEQAVFERGNRYRIEAEWNASDDLQQAIRSV